MEACREVEVLLRSFLPLTLDGVRGQLRTPVALLAGKDPSYPLNWWVGGPQSRSGRCEEERTSLAAVSIRTVPRVPSRQPSRHTDRANRVDRSV